MADPKRKVYAVAVGRSPGIYYSWPQTLEQVNRYPGAIYKSFGTEEEAQAWLAQKPTSHITSASPSTKPVKPKTVPAPPPVSDPDTIVIYTDGGALGNPGPGGYGAVLLYNEHCKELSGGFRLTTNNRMELTACIMALRSLTSRDKPVLLHSDSSYVVNGFKKGWVKSWKKRGWKKADGQPVLNMDLWGELADLVESFTITFIWVKGHAGNHYNERCDQLARESAAREDLPPDTIYENQTRQPAQAT